jgi:hypothetical protein
MEENMKLANEIQKALIGFIRGNGYEIVIPNFHLNGGWEMDLCRITPAGVVYEYEIKISRADYFQDFKKGYDSFGGHVVKNKHDLLKWGELDVNRFFFVLPEGLVKLDELPSYAGLITYKGGWFTPIRGGKMLRKKFNIDYKGLAESLSYRESILRGRVRYSEYLRKEAEGRYERALKELKDHENKYKVF